MTISRRLKNIRSGLAVLLTVSMLGMVSADAWAARLGAGRSLGRQSSTLSQRQAAPQAPAAVPAPAAPTAQRPATAGQPGVSAPQPSRSRWLGPLAGLAAGLGLAALASHFGFSEELGSLMMVMLLVFAVVAVVRIFAARRAFSAQGSGGPVFSGAGGSPTAYRSSNPDVGIGQEAHVGQAYERSMQRDSSAASPALGSSVAGGSADLNLAAPSSGSVLTIPAGFDTEGFLAAARRQFVRMQAVWDAADLSALREFSTDAMYEELARELHARGATANRTDVVSLEAELLGIESDASEHVASVRFHGLLREQEGATPQSFDEVWNLSKPVSGSQGWLLAGIQQLSAPV
jgi:predicted lipid-binding transport protein (Tim44 family)